MAASLHRLSRGRFVLGVGVGWARKEFEALEVPFNRRGTLTDEHLDEMHQIWGGGVEGVVPALAPEELPGPPVWIGGNSDAGIRRAVVAGQGWHPLGFTMDWIQDAVGRLKAFADEAGRAVPTLAPRIRLRLTAEAGHRRRPAGRHRDPGTGTRRPGPAARAGVGGRGAGPVPRGSGGAGAAGGGVAGAGRGGCRVGVVRGSELGLRGA